MITGARQPVASEARSTSPRDAWDTRLGDTDSIDSRPDRRTRRAVPAVALAWTGLPIITGTLAAADLPSAAALGAANAAVGVLMHQWVLGLVRRSHHAQ
jgi:hypothetical protein